MASKGAYYNEIDEYAAQWLENLIAAGHIADGVVDRRSIKDVTPDDLKGFTQCHFFAGIGVWSYALRLAGWDDDRPVWTGSCPCQPFSSAGEGKGFEDERHLWPDFFRLIKAERPKTVMGEQVASADGLTWLDLVFDDLESSDYSVRAADTCAAGFGAPHIRQRLYWVADSLRIGQSGQGFLGRSGDSEAHENREIGGTLNASGSSGLADTDSHRREQGQWDDTTARHRNTVTSTRDNGGLADTDGGNSGEERKQRSREQRLFSEDSRVSGLADTNSEQRNWSRDVWERGWAELTKQHAASQLVHGRWSGPTNGFWEDADWLFCRDGKWRPVRPETFCLVNGSPARMGRLRAYGNAINAHQAAGFIEAVM
ncbi:MAG: DNA cytosine methyltransferase, partial [Pseudomonadota bacterium]